MLDLSAYRLGFAPVVAALVVLAFSLEGVPEPLDPAAGTVEFDPARATEDARALVRAAPERAPGSEGAAAAADLVRQGFEEIATGTVAEQRFTASVDGDDAELRNVLLTLPGSDRAIAVVAGRGSESGSGAATSAAATGVLLELAADLGVSGHERTIILASIDGAGAEAEGTREMLEALPEGTVIEAAVVISQPGPAAPAEPHLITSSGDGERPSQTLIRTASETLAARGQAAAGLDGPLGQIARLALPAAAGTQAALLDEGVGAIAISGAGEVELPPDESGPDQLSAESVERFGASALALVGALDAATAAGEAPEAYVRLGDNTIPGWVLALLALALLVPPALPVAIELARAQRTDGTARKALGWAFEWSLVGLLPVIALYVLGRIGLIPSPEVPYDPGRFDVGATEVLALIALAGLAFGTWWMLGLRRAPALPAPATLGAAAGGVCVAACLAAWIANPLLALVISPLAHVVVVHGARGRRPAALAVPVALVAAVPLTATVLHVAGALGWGARTPWQLAVLVAGGTPGLVASAAVAIAAVAVLAVIRAAWRPGGSRGEGSYSGAV
jgi:hypothetical protein